mgnify:CR=1 FL=1
MKIIDKENIKPDLTEYQHSLWEKRIETDKAFGDIIQREEKRLSMFSNPIIHSTDVSPTITSSGLGLVAVGDL